MCEPWEDLPKDKFLHAMASHFATAWGGTSNDFINIAEGALQFVLGEKEMGDTDYDWCLAAAKEWAEEEMAYA